MMLVISNRCGLGEQVNDPRYERIQILRAAASAKVAISNELLVEPSCASVHKVVPHTGPTGQSSPFEQTSRREYPRTMTQACNRLFLAVKCAHELAGFLRLPQEIGVDKPSRNEQRIVVIGVRLPYCFRHLHARGRLMEVHSSNAALA